MVSFRLACGFWIVMVEREEHWCLAWCKILSSSFDGCVLVLLRHVMACDKKFQAFDLLFWEF